MSRATGGLKLKECATWDKFFRFDSFIVDKILQVFYIFGAVFSAIITVLMILFSIAGGIGAFLLALLGGVFVCLVYQVIHRALFELLMLGIVTARNAISIRRMMEQDRGIVSTPSAGGEEPASDPAPAPVPLASEPAAPVPPAAPTAAPEPPASAPVPEPEPAPAPEPAPEPTPAEPALADDTVACPACGEKNEPGSHFCGNCGGKLD